MARSLNMHVDQKFTFGKLKVPFANRLVVKLHSRILLNIKLTQTKFTAYNSLGPFKHLATISGGRIETVGTDRVDQERSWDYRGRSEHPS